MGNGLFIFLLQKKCCLLLNFYEFLNAGKMNAWQMQHR